MRKYIAVEGLEGAGKSTALNCISDFLKDLSLDVVSTREPGGTVLAEKMREVVKSNTDEEVTIETELMLMYGARSQLLKNVVSPALDNNKWVLSDRTHLSSLAYQGARFEIDGLNDALLLYLDKAIVKNLKPSLTFYLDIDPVLGFERVDNRGERDRIEQYHIDFFKAARRKYLQYAQEDHTIVVIDASKSIEEVQASILDVLESHPLFNKK